MDAERRKEVEKQIQTPDGVSTDWMPVAEQGGVDVTIAELRALLADSADRDTLEATVADWQQWHRQMTEALGCEYLERKVTLNAAYHAANEVGRLRAHLAQYEAQTIPRADDMPPGAYLWVKDLDGGCWWRTTIPSYPLDEHVWAAPDLLPDTPGPAYRAIVDLGREDG